MKKLFKLLMLILIQTLIFCACGAQAEQVKPNKVEEKEFDIQTAIQMVEKGEEIIAELSVKDTVSRHEYNQFFNNMNEIYGDYQWNHIFFYNEEFENKQINTLHLNKEMFFPTIYHKGIEVVSAKVTNNYYDNEFLNTSILTIREEFTGNDKKLEDWYREYYYQKDETDNWIFSGFGGQVNFLGDGFKSDYLELENNF